MSPLVVDALRRFGWNAEPDRIHRLFPQLEQATHEALVAYLSAWSAAEYGDFERAERELGEHMSIQELAGWALAGLALSSLRRRRFDQTAERLEQASALAGHDRDLRGMLQLLHGTMAFHQGDVDQALDRLESALAELQPDSFARGRVFDALGMCYAHYQDVVATRTFFERAMEHKLRVDDQSGLAVTHGQLGRLELDWGNNAAAEQHFRADLAVCESIGDARGAAQMHNFIGSTLIGQDKITQAVRHLDLAIEQSDSGGWTILAAFARKDRALCAIRTDRLDVADELLASARNTFESLEFRGGLAYVDRVTGVGRRLSRQWEESERCLRRSLAEFEATREFAEAARSQLELAHTLSAGSARRDVAVDAYVRAVELAETSRRPFLVRAADGALAREDPAAAARSVYRRVRGRGIDEDSTSMTTAERDEITALFFDVRGFTEWSRGLSPDVVMFSLNQMMAVFRETLVRHAIHVTGYLGDGFLAIARGPDHARRTVTAALELYDDLSRFNRPRRMLDLPEFAARIGISSGPAVLGNVGTYDMIQYTAYGTTVNLAARIQNEAIPGTPCVSETTWNEIAGTFKPCDGSPRTLTLKGLGKTWVWDVAADDVPRR